MNLEQLEGEVMVSQEAKIAYNANKKNIRNKMAEETE